MSDLFKNLNFGTDDEGGAVEDTVRGISGERVGDVPMLIFELVEFVNKLREVGKGRAIRRKI